MAWNNTLKKVTTASLTNSCIRILLSSGWNVWRQNTMAVYDKKRDIYRANTTKKGISDIIGFNMKTSQFIAVEIKNGKDKLSKEQEYFLNEVRNSGGIAIVVRNITDVENLLKSINEI